MKNNEPTKEVTYWIGTFEGRPHICQGENHDYKFVSLFATKADARAYYAKNVSLAKIVVLKPKVRKWKTKQ